MSHFTVLVIGEDVEYQLAPFHEFECTGRDDEFVTDVDRTEELREVYKRHTESRYRDPDGILHDPYEDKFYREPTKEEKKKHGEIIGTGGGDGIRWSSKDWGDGKGYRAKVHFLPKGWEEVEVPVREVKSFSDFVEDWSGQKRVKSIGDVILETEHKYGYCLMSGDEVVKVIDRTNENKHWDWWKLGGRWTGFFKLKPGRKGEVGEPGLQTENAKEGWCDGAKKKDIDFDGMRDTRVAERLERYDLFHKIVAGRSIPSWKTIRDRNNGDIKEARKEWNENQVVKDLDKDFFIDAFENYDMTRDKFVEMESRKALCTHAVVKDRKWYECGRMGWWACVSDEKDEGVWEKEFAELIDALPGDTLLTLVDCHI